MATLQGQANDITWMTEFIFIFYSNMDGEKNAEKEDGQRSWGQGLSSVNI